MSVEFRFLTRTSLSYESIINGLGSRRGGWERFFAALRMTWDEWRMIWVNGATIVAALRHPSESDEYESPEGVTYLTGEAARAFFDQEVRRLVGISGDEFIRCYDAGEYETIEDIPENWNILEAALLIGFGRAR